MPMSAPTYWHRFKPIIAARPPVPDRAPPAAELQLWDDARRGLSCHYAPFDYINREARIVLIGITPGHTQMNRALRAVHDALRAGDEDESALRKAKQAASLGGPLRANMVRVLDRLGYAARLGLPTSARLWDSADHLVHFTSLLKYPVFVRGRNYSGQPNMLTTPRLRQSLEHGFISDMARLEADVELVPLGQTVAEVVARLVAEKRIAQRLRLYRGEPVHPPHPSGANAEVIGLILRQQLPDLATYQAQAYTAYRTRTGDTCRQAEPAYRRSRAQRWQQARRIRCAYGLD